MSEWDSIELEGLFARKNELENQIIHKNENSWTRSDLADMCNAIQKLQEKYNESQPR